MDPNVTLRDYQVADLAFYMANPRCLNLSDPGTGKTPSVCVMQWWRWKEHGVGTAWVMPKSLMAKNKVELLRFTEFEDKDVVIVDDVKPFTPAQDSMTTTLFKGMYTMEDFDRKDQRIIKSLINQGLVSIITEPLQELGQFQGQLWVDRDAWHAVLEGVPRSLINPTAKVFIMGFDRFARSWEHLPDYVKAVDVDEIHMGFGGNKSQRTNAFFEAMKRMKWFIGMTGTLVNGRLDTAYPAIHVIEPRYYGNYHAFYNYHAIEDPFGSVVGWKNHEKLAAIFGRHGIRRTFEDVYGPEAKVVQTELVAMHPRQRDAYDTFQAQAILELEQFYLDGTHPGVAFIRARQIMEHPNLFPDLVNSGKTVDLMKGELPGKIQNLEVHFTDHARTGKPLVVFAALVPQQEQIHQFAESAKLRSAVMNGNTSAVQRGKIDEAFRNGHLDVLVCSPRVASVGFNWQVSGGQEVDHVIFASLDYLDTTFLQAYRRLMRDRRKTPLRITILEYASSLDQRIFEIIKRKSEDAHKVDPTRQKLDFTSQEDAVFL